MNGNRKGNSYNKQLIDIKEYKTHFVTLRSHFNSKRSTSLSKLKTSTNTNYDYMNILKNDNFMWKTTEVPEEIKKHYSYSKKLFRKIHYTCFTIEKSKSNIVNDNFQFCINILKGTADLENLNLSRIQT